jgi:hypothetical protein
MRSGTNEGDNFMGLRLIRDTDRINAVRDLLGAETITADQTELTRAEELAADLAHALGQEQIIPAENVLHVSGSYAPTQREIVFKRAEALLVQAYATWLPVGAQTERIRCVSGVTDLYVSDGDSHDLIEAKCGASHAYVRQALGQILDYAHAITAPISTLSVLLPERPSTEDLSLLGTYGVGCIYRSEALTFQRSSAPAARRSAWQK